MASRAGTSSPVDGRAQSSPAEGSTAAGVGERSALDSVAERFAHVHTWVFDLDNTLYPSGSAIWPKIDDRITRYLAELFGIDGMSARALQKFYYQRYGTTLAGLIADHNISHEQFLGFVHDIDRSSLAPHPALVEAISALPGRKLILTNGSTHHALRTTEQLGFVDTFEAVFDIVDANLVPKPDPATYDRFFARHGVDPKHAAMFEDIARNLIVPHERGMMTVLVVPQAKRADNREAWEAEEGADSYVDFITDDIATFVAGLALARAV
jgi:putative hydrolase of the HAD superfamily